MKVSIWLLSCALLAATVATGARGGSNEDAPAGPKSGGGVAREAPVLLAGANGHDTVGGLMPLPLWPSHAVRAQEVVPGKPWKARSRRCPSHPCARGHD